MKSIKGSQGIKCFALAALAIALGSGLANAQGLPEFAGEFNLSFTARWGTLTLAPGHYSFTLWSDHIGTRGITVRRGLRGLGMVLGHVTANQRFDDPSRMTAVRVGAAYQIVSLQLSDLGVEMTFFAPKHELLEASQTTQPARNLPVQVASN